MASREYKTNDIDISYFYLAISTRMNRRRWNVCFLDLTKIRYPRFLHKHQNHHHKPGRHVIKVLSMVGATDVAPITQFYEFSIGSGTWYWYI